MLPRHHEPIVAIATAAGRGAVGIVRASGASLDALIGAVCGRPLVPRHATYLPFLDAAGRPIDQGLAIHFPAPASYTGEAVLELQAHGGPVVLQLLLARCLEAMPALRLAGPGEFSDLCFLIDMLVLAQAVDVAELILAITEAAARWPRRCCACACWSRRRSTFRTRRSTFSSRPTRAAGSNASPCSSTRCSIARARSRCCERASRWS